MPNFRPLSHFAPAIAVLLLAPFVPAAAQAAEPSIEQIHALAADGHLDRALAQMAPVLKAHPGSAKAHYVEAELLARADRATQGRSELARAEQISPGLPFADVYSVAELNRQLSLGPETPISAPVTGRQGSTIPWMPIAALGAAAIGLYMMFRRRSAALPSPSAQMGSGAGIWGNSASGATGSGLLGSLASGAAMGAGFAVGEEAIEKMFGSEHRNAREIDGNPNAGWDVDQDANRDMGGGNDFGITDDRSWDDSSTDGGGW